MTDYTNTYNTQLTPAEEHLFQKWVADTSKIQGRDITRDLADYDIRGHFRELGGRVLKPGEHGTDRYKKPNHPTFSDESIYSTPLRQGGSWRGSKFYASPMNLVHQSVDDLRKYMHKNESGTELVLPGERLKPTFRQSK
jgi:hypothetical protein